MNDRPRNDGDGGHVQRGRVCVDLSGREIPQARRKMPGTVGVTVLAARDLPVMDRASELTDAFVEVR